MAPSHWQVPSHADFHFTWRSPHPYAGEAGQLSGTAAFFTVLLVLAIMGKWVSVMVGWKTFAVEWESHLDLKK